jgi:serine/threonine protein kinase
MARALGRYELLRPLARGGMAEVYLARRRAAGIEKWLVVKRMRPERSGDPRFLDLFVREARLSMSLAHQNIVPVFDFGRIDDQVFLAMERVEGKDLGSSLARAPDHRLPPLLAAFVAAECCQALDYAHQRKSPDGVALGIVHRDVTPRNVLLSWSGEVKLTDFGIAALAGDATSRLLGTPQYMAPEQARSEPIDPRADIYAIGLVLREAITGVRPRPGADRDAMLDAARRGALVPWPHLSPPAPDAELALGSGDHEPGEPRPAPDAPPPALVAIIESAAAATPADRYPDARSMLEDLDAFMVADRAAHKGESPTRQLAAWLAGVWDGARDDAESDAAIHAEHLVSFLDDGAIDVLGTGTIRSLAATAAEDVPEPASPAPAPAAPPPPAPAPGAKATIIVAPEASAGAPAVAPPGLRPEGAARSSRASSTVSRISSSTSTVASGSIHAIPKPGDPGRGRMQRRSARALSPVLSLVAVAIAAGATVFWVMTSLRDRPAAGPPAAGPPAAGQTATGQPVTGQPTAEPSAGQSVTGQPATGQPATGQPATGQPATGQPATGQPATEQPATGQPAMGQPAMGQPATGQPATGQPATGQPTTGPHSTGRPGNGTGAKPIGSRAGSPGAEHPGAGRPTSGPNAGAQAAHTGAGAPGGSGSGSPEAGSGAAGSGAEGASGADRPRPPTCKVRINLTPWAYYTADEDGARHETPGTIDLTPGPHRLHVWNPELHVERDIVLQVPADRDTMNYSEPLQPSSLRPDAGLP